MAEKQVDTETKEEVKTSEKEAPAAESQPAETAEETKSTAAPVIPDGYVPVSAVQEERKKRQARDREIQETQRRLAYLEGQLAEKSKTVEKPAASQFDETEYFTNPAKVVSEMAEKIASEKLEAAEKARFEKKTAYSRNKAMKKYGAEEYLSMEAEFTERAKTDVSLWDPVNFMDDPATYVVDTVKSWRTETDAVSKLSAAEAEIARLKEQLKNGGAPVKETMPASNAGARGSGATNTSNQSRKGVRDDNMLDAMLN